MSRPSSDALAAAWCAPRSALGGGGAPAPPPREAVFVETVVTPHELDERHGGAFVDARVRVRHRLEAKRAVPVGAVQLGQGLERGLAQQREHGFVG